MVVICLAYMLEIAFCKRTNNFGSFCCCYVPHAQDLYLELIVGEAKACRSLSQGQAGLRSKFQASHGYADKPCSNNSKTLNTKQ